MGGDTGKGLSLTAAGGVKAGFCGAEGGLGADEGGWGTGDGGVLAKGEQDGAEHGVEVSLFGIHVQLM